MMNETGVQRVLPDQSSASGHTYGTLRHQSVRDPIPSKRVCFYKSGDPQFSGLRLVINNRTFKTFDALLDSLSKKVPLPFGVRNITTPHGVHVINTLDELEDGKSYICSDSRKVKPINLALARKKLPPWYHARPVSSRRRTVQQARFFPGRSMHKAAPALVRTPKRLLVFRNGEPGVKHTVVLHKKNTPSYESILEYLSELMQLHVVKLYTPDGKRVDGLPGLILCAGTVVAVGREPFRPAVYSSQKTPPAAKLHSRRQKFLNRKKKSLSNSSKLRNFSPSSERYIVRQIHNSIAGSSFGLPSNPTNSVERDSSRILESVAETEGDTCLGDGGGGQYCSLPDDDDIEKSFRVNQDGSMTVEMRVRLTIKEQETVHWTTTLSRSTVNSCLPEPEPMEEICSAGSNPMDLQTSPASSIDEDNTKDDGDKGPLSLSNGALSEGSPEEDAMKTHSDLMFPRRFPTPGHKQTSTRQASVESSKSVTPNGIQEELVGSYSYRERTENGEMTEQYCVVKQSSSRPVPKPRRLGSIDCSGRYLSEFNSAGMSEVLQVESSGEEVTETVLHIYEQQTCQDNYFANTCAHRMSPPKTTFDRPATAESGKLSCNNEFEPELCRPSTASESVSIWRAESTSVASEFNSASLNAGANNVTKRQQQLQKPGNGQVTSYPAEDSKDKRASTKHKVTNKHVRWSRTPGKRPKKSSAETPESQVKAKHFSSSKFIKGIYGSKSKSGKSTKTSRKRPTKNENGSVTTNSLSDDTIKQRDSTPAVSKGYRRGKVSSQSSRRNQSSPEVSRPRGILTRQTSMHIEKKSQNGSRADIGSGPLPAFNCTSSSMNEYVENWLEKAQLGPQAENLRCSESGNQQGLNAEAGEGNRGTQKLSTCQSSERQAETIVGTSVKLKIQSFENKAAGPPVKKSTVSEDNPSNTAASFNPDTCKGPLQAGTDDTKPLLNGFCAEMSPPVTNRSAEMPPSDNKSSSVKILFQQATPSNTLSMELPPPPSADEIAELSNSECVTKDASEVSSPLYKLSSSSSPHADSSLVSPSSEEVASAAGDTTGTASSVQAEATLSRSPSVRKAPLVSNLSLERKMSLRKASADKHTLGGESPPKMDAIPTTDKPEGGDILLNGKSSSKAHEPIRTLPEDIHSFSRASSHSPASLSSDERLSSTSISSSEVSVPSSQKTSSSPKTSVKAVKLASSPSPERKLLSRKSALELPRNSPTLPSLQNRPAKDASPDVGPRRHAPSNGSPAAERKPKLYKPKQQKRLSPYSQTLDVVSPPVRHKSGKKSLHRNLSLERKVLTPRKNASPEKGTADLDATLADDSLLSLVADQREGSGRPLKASQPLNTENQPDMKPVLEKICFSIKAIRQMTQSKRPSCLEKSNSLPDFSSHVASTFGSSSKALLAFLSVMTLKEGITNLNVDELNANNVSCAEALKMIDSLAEIANIEDSHKLRSSLSDLQRSASKQLLQSWRGFQELSDRCKSRSSTANSSERELVTAASPDQDCGFEENAIDELMESFDMPEKLKEELVCLSEGTKSPIETEMSERKTAEVESNDDAGTNQPATDNVGDAPRNDQANVSVRSIIERFTHNDQPKQTGTTCDLSECKPLGQSYVARCPPVEQIPGDMQRCSTSAAREEPKQQHNAVVSQQSALMKGATNGETDLLEECCYLRTEKQESDCRRLQLESQKHTNLSNNEFTSDDSGSEKAALKKQTEKDVLTQDESCEQSPLSPDTEDRKRAEEAEVVVGGRNEQSSEDDDDLSNPESPSEEEEDKEPSPGCCEEDRAREGNGLSHVDSEKEVGSEEEQPELQYSKLNGSLEDEAQKCRMGMNVSDEDSTENSDEDETSSEEEKPEADSKQLQVIVEETSSGIEEEDEEVGPVYVPPPDREQTAKTRWLEALLEEAEDDHLSSEEAEKTHTGEKARNYGTQGEDPGDVGENEDTENDSVAKRYRFITNDDSGNDQGSCEQHLDEDQSRPEDEQTSSSLDEELSYYGKESSSEEEKANTGHTLRQEGCFGQALSDVSNGRIASEREVTSQSVAERVTLLEQQVADAQKRTCSTRSSAARRSSQRNDPAESDADDSPSESPSSQTALCTRSAPQSSLSFSYDSSGVITTEPEGNRVRSIREMFLAKSAADVQQKRAPSSSASERLDFRAETSVSGGYQSQTPSEPSSGEDDSARKSITKGFVRRTIERLYGKKGAQPDEGADDRPPSGQKQNHKEHSSLFSSLQTARTKAMSELSYFNSTNALDTLTEATRCIAFNAQVGPGDSVPIDHGRWLLGENSLIRKSISDPVGINKSFTSTPERDDVWKDTEESTPYSLFSTKSELEDKAKSFSRKCTYFSLPHGSDSDACQDDVPKGCPNGDPAVEAEDVSKDTGTWAERNGKLPGGSVTDFRIGDNKVHPLTEGAPDAEVVVKQPAKGQGVLNRRLQEPDMLDFLYNFCGQNCPIL